MLTSSASRSDRPGNSTRSSKAATTCTALQPTPASSRRLTWPSPRMQSGGLARSFMAWLFPAGWRQRVDAQRPTVNRQGEEARQILALTPRPDRLIRFCSSSPRHRSTASHNTHDLQCRGTAHSAGAGRSRLGLRARAVLIGPGRPYSVERLACSRLPRQRNQLD